MKIKLCGIKRLEDVDYANEFLPDFIGFVFADSKRQVTPLQALKLKNNLKYCIKTVGVFVNETVEALMQTATLVGLDVIQLHGEEDEEYIKLVKKELPEIQIWKAVRVVDEESILNADSLSVSMLLLDAFSKEAYGGTGHTANWDAINNVKNKLTKPFFLAGGLHAGNIREAINSVAPEGVDISSGIETDGVKVREKIKAIMEVLRNE